MTREPRSLAKLNHTFTREGFGEAPMFAAQNCMYIQAVGGNMLQIKGQEMLTSQTNCVWYPPGDPCEVRNEWGT